MDEFEDDRPHRCTTFLYYVWKIFTILFTHVMLVTTVVAYCILGAFTFESLEKENEIKVKNNITYMRNNVTEDLWVLTQNTDVLHEAKWTNSVLARLKTFENDLVVAMKKNGWDGSEDSDALQWTFAGALFYSIIVITTIGYGHIAPKTHFGKVTTIFYAILGIPLMLLCLSNIGDIMAHSFRFLYWRICCYACTRPPKRGHHHHHHHHHHSTHRRGRSFRGTVRSHGSGSRPRTSRTSSLRKWGRNQGSQRSADSALAMSETLTHSYSDTECRYFEETERELAMLGVQGRNPMYKRQSQNSRHSIERGASVPLSTYVPPSKQKGMEDAREMTSSPPVLFNKYALDREDSRRAHRDRDHDRGRDRESQAVRRMARGQSATPVLQSRTREDVDVPVPKRHAHSARHYLTVEPPAVSEGYRPAPSPRHNYSGRRTQELQPHTSTRAMAQMELPVPVPVRSTYPRFREIDYYDDYEYYDYADDTSQIKPVPIWLCVFLVVSYIIGGAFLFSGWEGWGYADSAYFCFITLTTIGFGDFVPAQRVNKKNAEVSIALCSLYLLFGIALLAMSFNLVQEEVISNVKSVARHLGIIKDDEDEDD